VWKQRVGVTIRTSNLRIEIATALALLTHLFSSVSNTCLFLAGTPLSTATWRQRSADRRTARCRPSLAQDEAGLLLERDQTDAISATPLPRHTRRAPLQSEPVRGDQHCRNQGRMCVCHCDVTYCCARDREFVERNFRSWLFSRDNVVCCGLRLKVTGTGWKDFKPNANLLWRERFFVRISPNLPEELFARIFPPTQITNTFSFGMISKKSLQVIPHMLGAKFSKSKMLGAIFARIFRHFANIFKDLSRI